MIRHNVKLACYATTIVLALLLAGVLAQWGIAQAAGVLYVSTVGNDANSCLTMSSACRTIVSAVNKASPGDTIVIAGGVYTEGINISKDLTLIGFGAEATILDQGHITVSGATVHIFDLAITNGHDGFGDGGLINNGGNLSLSYTSILSGYGGDGAGIYNFFGTLTLDHTTVAGNEAARYGGGIDNENGNVYIRYSNIYSNTTCNTICTRAGLNGRASKPATGFLSLGGGIYTVFGSMTIEASTVISNVSFSGGDGIYNGSMLVITNSTISNNANNSGYGGYGIENSADVTLTNVTMSGNDRNLRAIGPDRAVIHNSILANSSSGNNCVGSNIISLGHNLSSDNSCSLNASGDMTNTNPLLGPLQDNGGATPTHALLSGSPAINAGTNSGCPATDQRGIARPQAGICDIGAFEFVFSYSTFLPVVAR